MGSFFWLPVSLALALASGSSPRDIAWSELTLSIEEDRGFSSDHVTLCRVRVVNQGSSSWPGRRLVFEARAVRGGQVAARQRGRFGLTLGPRETLETIVGFVGRFDRFEVAPRPGKNPSKESEDAHGRRQGRSKKGRSKKGG